MTVTYQLDDLIYLMERLRDPADGCPWDKAQSWQDIIPHTLEEVYEVIDAINNKDWTHVEEELGDLLFQVVFYCQLASEQQDFNFNSVIHKLVEKLIRRHPHVFPDSTLLSRTTDKPVDELVIKENWDKIKLAEKQSKGQIPDSLIEDIPVALPALQKAVKLQKKVSKTGLDWPDAQSVFQVVRDELDELEQAYSENDKAAIAEELGDVFFSLVNLSRKLGEDAEQSLLASNTKFANRFRWIEKHIQSKNLKFDALNEDDLDKLWEMAKKN